MQHIIKTLLCSLIAMPTVLLSKPSNAPSKQYGPQVSLSAKGGNKRFMGRAGLLVPLLQNTQNMLFLTSFAMFDCKRSQEGNFGLV